MAEIHIIKKNRYLKTPENFIKKGTRSTKSLLVWCFNKCSYSCSISNISQAAFIDIKDMKHWQHSYRPVMILHKHPNSK